MLDNTIILYHTLIKAYFNRSTSYSDVSSWAWCSMHSSIKITRQLQVHSVAYTIWWLGLLRVQNENGFICAIVQFLTGLLQRWCWRPWHVQLYDIQR